MKKKNKQKKKIKLKVNEARKLFATAVSRAGNKVQIIASSAEDNSEAKEGSEDEPVFSPTANHALTKQLDGTLEFELGSTQLWTARASKGFGSILKKDYDVPSNLKREEYRERYKVPIPKEALENAKVYRSISYEKLSGVNDIIKAMVFSKPLKQGVGVSFQIFSGIYIAPKGLVSMPLATESSQGAHTVYVFGFDHQARRFKFVNSWGTAWGDGGYGYLPYEYLDKYFIEAIKPVYPIWIQDHGYIVSEHSVGEFKYQMVRDDSMVYGRQPLYVIDVYEGDNIAGWLHFRFGDDGKEIKIEEIFVLPIYRQKGIATQLLVDTEKFATYYIVNKVSGYIHSQDLLTDENVKVIENLFKDYEFRKNTKAFKGCAYEVIKDNVISLR